MPGISLCVLSVLSSTLQKGAGGRNYCSSGSAYLSHISHKRGRIYNFIYLFIYLLYFFF